MLGVRSARLVVNAIKGAEVSELAATEFSTIVSPDNLDREACLIVN
jgi:hypothetical protein